MGSRRDGMMTMLSLMNNIQVQICVFSIVIKQLSFCIEFKLKVQARMMKQLRPLTGYMLQTGYMLVMVTCFILGEETQMASDTTGTLNL